jgi:hypothetical protein
MWSLLPDGRWQRLALLGCAVLAVAHQAARWDWFIEDAAICFAYARNLAAGEGFVPYPGAERVEGISDPTWLVLLTALQAVGLSGFVAAKPLAMALTVATLPVLWRAARDAMPDDDGTYALAAPFAYATYAQVAIWGASGLENPLWGLLLAAALLWGARDAAEGRFLRSSLLWLLLAWTRPEGIAYAAIGGGWWLLHLVRAGHRPLRPTLGWLAVFFVPTAVLYGLRYWYFAWPVSNTWYAKVGARPTYPFRWEARGWAQAREWAGRLWYGWYAPVYQLGLVGVRGRGAAASWCLTALIAAMLCWPGPEALAQLRAWPDLPPPPGWFVHARMACLAAAGVGFPFLVLGRPGAPILGPAWSTAALALAFSVYADGDWMGAYRWMNLLCAPAAILFAAGLREAAPLLRRAVPSPDPSWSRMGVALLLFGLVPPNLSQTRDHRTYNRNETPSMVSRRVRFTQDLVRRTFHEGRVRNLEMDMGAHLWFAPEYVELDMAGLVNVPMSRHWYHQTAFVEEYLFTENPPTFGHVHGWWAKESRLKTYDWWRRWMVEVGPYVDEPPLPLHDGVWAHRSLFSAPAWPGGEGRRVAFAGGVVLHGVEVPVEVWAAGGEGYLEVGLTRDVPADFRVIAFLAREGRLASVELPLGYGEHPPEAWRAGEEVYVGRHVFRVPEGLAPGPWALGFVVLDGDGRVLPASPDAALGPGGSVPVGNAAAYAEGEVRFAGLVTVGTPDDVARARQAALERTEAAAAGGDCEAAERGLVVAKRARPRDWDGHRALRAEVAPSLAACWAARAAAEADPVPSLARAHEWDHRSPDLARVGGPIGERLWAEGLAARAAGDAEAAYRAFAGLLRFQPWRSWARRYAEEARDERLGIVAGPPPELQDLPDPEEDQDAPR